MYKVKSINLNKYFLAVVLSITFTVIMSFILTILFKWSMYISLIIAIIIGFLFIWFIENKLTIIVKMSIKNRKEVNIHFVGNKNIKTFQINEIENITYKKIFRNFPLFKIVLKNKKVIKFNCRDKANIDLEDFIDKLSQLRHSAVEP